MIGEMIVLVGCVTSVETSHDKRHWINPASEERHKIERIDTTAPVEVIECKQIKFRGVVDKSRPLRRIKHIPINRG